MSFHSLWMRENRDDYFDHSIMVCSSLGVCASKVYFLVIWFPNQIGFFFIVVILNASFVFYRFFMNGWLKWNDLILSVIILSSLTKWPIKLTMVIAQHKSNAVLLSIQFYFYIHFSNIHCQKAALQAIQFYSRCTLHNQKFMDTWPLNHMCFLNMPFKI